MPKFAKNRNFGTAACATWAVLGHARAELQQSGNQMKANFSGYPTHPLVSDFTQLNLKYAALKFASY